MERIQNLKVWSKWTPLSPHKYHQKKTTKKSNIFTSKLLWRRSNPQLFTIFTIPLRTVTVKIPEEEIWTEISTDATAQTA